MPWLQRGLDVAGCAMLILALAARFWESDVVPARFGLKVYWLAYVVGGLLLMAPAFFHRIRFQKESRSSGRLPEHEKLIQTLGDPVAELTEWTPVHHGGSTFPMHQLIVVSDHRLEFRPTREMARFHHIFVATGVLFLGIAVFAAARSLTYLAWATALTSLLVGGGGIGFYRFATRSRVLDRNAGWYWKGKFPCDVANGRRRSDAVLLKDVHAVQVLRKERDASNPDIAGSGTYPSFEINLVMRDGSRVNVTSSGGDRGTIFRDAMRIGEFIDVAVWNAS